MLGIEGGPCAGQSVAVKVGEHGRPSGTMLIGGGEYVLRMFGAEPHPEADWHYCHRPEEQG